MRARFAFLLLCLSPLGAGAQTLAEQVLEQTNLARWENGQLPPLKGHAQLDASATLHSTNMGVRNFFMHCDPDTLKTFSTRISDAGYGWSNAAENIAAGSSSAAAVMNQWMNSSGHRTNILSSSYNELGVGYYYEATDSTAKRTSSGGCNVTGSLSGAFRHYWTQNFGRRSGAYPLVIAREAYRATVCTIDLYVYGSGFASQMRFSNDGTTWSAWEPYNTGRLWTLRGSSGSVATVRAEIRSSAGSVRQAQDSIVLGVACAAGGSPTPPARVFQSGFE